MAYDRFDRDERPRWSDRGEDRSGRDWRGDDRGPRAERGFWDRASDQVASWFGDDEAERRRRQDERMGGDDRGWRGNERDWRHDRERSQGRFPDRDHGRDQSSFGGGRSDRDFN
jgi:hypothetical protein